MSIDLGQFRLPAVPSGEPPAPKASNAPATGPMVVIGLLSAALFGLFYMAALNNPSIVAPPKPVPLVAKVAPVTTAKPAAPPLTSSQVPAATVPKPERPRLVTRGELREIQTLLKDAGYDPGPADGLMGRKTHGAIAAFAEAHGIELGPEPDLALLEAVRAAAR
ncbi:hypothetical protein N825_29300 [Skermanella stibiiresistens SB22]|uniref:Peptidoglycan binding-like domain-containing protein n=1 Tax=Skermanella stibiiresistens SB22 TaxID=1385369 RepID=W9GUW7_9PROT|nr:peptidoglycan-binding domain-containing protein [Skermanella stibiiresistens]EWY36222.1 hypothetical protein N825_29300 [Skermanella stibiiresistens SB22]